MHDELWCASRYAKVYAVLATSLDMPSRNVAPGTIAEIGRAIDHFRARGARTEVARLEAISLTIAALHEALRARDERTQLRLRHHLSVQARSWLLAAPMFPDGGQLAPTRRAA